MAGAPTIGVHDVKQFEDELVDLVRQEGSMIQPIADERTGYGIAQAVERLDTSAEESNEVTDRFGYTKLTNPDHSRRWAHPKTKAWATPWSRYDQTRMMVNPMGNYVRAHAEVQGRFYDDEFIRGLGGVVYEGEEGTTRSPFPSANVIDVAGLTKPSTHQGNLLGALVQANKMLNANEVSRMHPRYCIISAEEEAELLAEDFVTTIDRNYRKTLPDAMLPMIYGFEFIVLERLPVSASKRSCFAFAKPGMRMYINRPLSVRVDERPDMNYLTQIYSDCEIGSVRVDDKMVIKLETTAS